MTPSESVNMMLADLAKAHGQDQDGGYAFAFAIRDLHGNLERREQAELVSALACSLLTRDRLWRVAAEALIQIGSLERGAELVAAVRANSYDWEWRDDVIFALLCLRYVVEPTFYEEYVGRALEDERPHGVPLVAALARILPDESTGLLSRWLVRSRSRGKDVEGYVATIVRNYLAADEKLLADLLRKIRRRNSDDARWFAGCMKSYLGKPWVLKELGDTRSARIRAEIASASGISN
jgi:hypothetical protein